MAIKKGHIYIGYDIGFVFGEVNADRIYWIVEQKGDQSIIKGTVLYCLASRQISNRILGIGNRETRAIGKDISTKSVNSFERKYLTNDYKWPEGSEEEREAWQTAFNFSSGPASHHAKFLARFS